LTAVTRAPKQSAIPARMSFADCAARAEQAERRYKRRVLKEQRQAERAMRGRGAEIWDGARMSRLEFDFIARLRSADEEIKRDAHTLRARARDIAKNNPLGKNYRRIILNGVIGPTGFDHEAQVLGADGKPDKTINATIDGAFDAWAAGPVTRDGSLNLLMLQRQLFPTTRVEGDAFVRLWEGSDVNDFGLALEPIDPDQVDHTYNQEAIAGRQNEIRMGVELDADGKRVAYHVFRGPYTGSLVRERERIPAEQIVHVYDPERANQTRGVTDFHAVLLEMHFLWHYFESELVAARLGSSQPVIWERIEGSQYGSEDPAATEAEKNKRRELTELEPGTFGYAPDGYRPSAFKLDHPTTAFSDFVKACERKVSAGLGISYGELCADHSDASFSAQRHATESTRDTLRDMQAWWTVMFLWPIYRAWLKNALLAGAASRGRKGLVLPDSANWRRYAAVKFEPRGFDYIDPVKDRTADVLALDNGLDCATDIVARRRQGRTFEQIARKRAEEIALCKELGIPSSSAEVLALAQAAVAAGDAEDKAAADAAAAKRSLTNGHTNGHGKREQLVRALAGGN